MGVFPERVGTERLVLRRLAPGDRCEYVEVHSDPATNRHHPVPDAWTPAAVEVSFSERLTDWDRDGFGYGAVATLGQPRSVIGFTGVRRVLVTDRQVFNLYYRYRPDVWGRGYAAEGARAAIKAAADALPELAVVAKTTPDNLGSQRTALASGLVRHPSLDRSQNGWTDIYFTRNWGQEHPAR